MSENSLEERISALLKILGYSIDKQVVSKGKSGLAYTIDLKFEYNSKIIFIECKSTEITKKDILSAYGKLTDLPCDLLFFVASELSSKQILDLKLLGMIPIIVTKSLESEANFMLEVDRWVKTLETGKKPLDIKRVEEIDCFYFKPSPQTTLWGMKSSIDELAFKLNYQLDFILSSENLYLNRKNDWLPEFSIHWARKGFIRLDVQKFSRRTSDIIKRIISSPTLCPYQVKDESIAKLATGNNKLPGQLRAITLKSRNEDLVAFTQLQFLKGSNPERYYQDKIASKQHVLRVEFRIEPQGFLRLSTSPTLRINCKMPDPEKLRALVDFCEGALLEDI